MTDSNIMSKTITKMSKKWKMYILWFAQEHVDFRKPEFESVTELLKLPFRMKTNSVDKPFWIVEFPSDNEALEYASRSIALRGILELWSHGNNYNEFHNRLQEYLRFHQNSIEDYCHTDRTFKITVETYNKHISQNEKIGRIESMSYLPVKGAVDLKKPDVEWWYVEFWGLNPKEVPEEPFDVLFGRLLSCGQRHLIKELSLKKRKFIGNTSMDAQLSLLMANQAKVKFGDLVFDPFVGSGSLLVSAAKFGAMVMGADIDFMMIHARSRPSRITQKIRDKDESILANLHQYGCSDKFIGVVVADFSKRLWRHDVKFNAIITDPPYGIREATECIEAKNLENPITGCENMPHYPSTTRYHLQDLYNDLLDFAAQHLVLHGRLVCWLPYHRDRYTDDYIPRHQYLQLVGKSVQSLSTQISRILLTYQKIYEVNSCSANESSVQTPQINAFRESYFMNGIESRTERRMRKAALREQGRLEAIKRGKCVVDSRSHKCNLNKARFD